MQFKRGKKGPVDLVAMDIASTAVKVVRLKREGQGESQKISLLGAAILPPRVLTPSAAPVHEKGAKPFPLPKNLQGKHLALAITGKLAIIKVLSLPGKIEDAAETQINELMGLEKPEEYRISYKVLSEGRGRSESKILTVAIPDGDVVTALQLFPIGLPAPYSVEISGLATMTSFLHGPGAQHAEDAVGCIDFGAELSYCALFNKGVLSLIRKFDIGANAILNRVQKSLGVDQETAFGIVTDGAFDLSQTIGEVMDPLIKQLVVSRDFVERRENCHIGSLYVSGGMVGSRDWFNSLQSSMGLPITPWNPLDGITIQPNALPDTYKGRESQFAAAMGAGLGAFEES